MDYIFDIGISLVIIAVLGILSHFLGEKIPRESLNYSKFPFKEFNFEKSGKLYKFLRVRKWKDKVPDASKFAKDMYRKKVGLSRDPKHILRLIQETLVAETVHIALFLVSFVFVLFTKSVLGILVSVLYALSNVPFIIIQRYNRPKLIKLYQKLLSADNSAESKERVLASKEFDK